MQYAWETWREERTGERQGKQGSRSKGCSLMACGFPTSSTTWASLQSSSVSGRESGTQRPSRFVRGRRQHQSLRWSQRRPDIRYCRESDRLDICTLLSHMEPMTHTEQTPHDCQDDITLRGMATLSEFIRAPSKPDPSVPTGHLTLTCHSRGSTTSQPVCLYSSCYLERLRLSKENALKRQFSI